MNRTATVALNTVSNYARFGISAAVYFLLTPYVISSVGADNYGLWSLTFSVLGLVALIESGIGASAVKFTADCDARGDVDLRNRLLSTLLVISLVLAVLAVVAVALLTFFYSRIFRIEPEKQTLAIALLWILAARMIFLYLPLCLFRGVLGGTQRIALINVVLVLGDVLYGLSAWAVLSSGMGLVALALVNLGAMLFQQVGFVFFARRTISDLRISPKLAERKRVKKLAGFSLARFVVAVSTLILFRTDPLLIKLFMPLSAVAVYAVALHIAEYAYQLCKQFVDALTPMVAHLHGAGDSQKIRFVLINCTRFAFVPATILAVMSYVHAQQGMIRWLGPDFAQAGWVLIILVTALWIATPQRSASAVLTMTDRHKQVAGAAAAGAVINVVVSLALIRPLGLIGVALGTLTATVLIDVFVVLRSACRRYGLTLSNYLWRVLPASIVPGACQFAVTWFIKYLAPPNSLGMIALQCLPGIVVYLAVFWLGFVERSEKDLLAAKLLPRRWRSRVIPPYESHDENGGLNP